MCDGLKFEPDPSCVRAGFRNRLYEGNDHTAETSTPRQCRALAGRCVLHPSHFAMLFLSAEPANSWIVGKQEVGPTGNAARCPPTGDSVALSVTSSSNYCTRWYTSVFQNHFFLAFTFAHLAR